MEETLAPLQARILVVDDNETNRDMLSRRVSRLGHIPVEAVNGREALDVMATEDFDMVLLDIMMPEMNGYQVLEIMHADSRLRHVPVVAVSALSEMDSVVRCIELGAEDYLFKPINSILLNARVNAALEKKWLRDKEQAYVAAIKREMALGRQIQSDFLPNSLPQTTGWQIGVRFFPAYEVAGDFYDAFTLPQNLLTTIVADVSGKGVGAAIFMALVRSLLRAYSDQNHASPQEVLEAVARTNAYIIRHHQHQAYMFATLFYGVLETTSGALYYVNAGHLPPVLIRATGETEMLNTTGPLVGVTDEIPFKMGTTTLRPGDTLLAYTDGITEADSPSGELFGMESLRDILGHPSHSAESTLKQVMDAVKQHIGSDEFSDDLTIMALHRETAPHWP
jgi:phosphoserine phosphatase RsbU/P